ncbi:mucin-5AC-like [Physella acuta]|uniref:mucin-5AC-like n=1 Tax=Physella acuta TaxID=109671 RepID=UPI0027DC5267|nr:mucin-5AC-like [Physella acuta]
MKLLLTCIVLLNACQFYFISAAPTVDTECHMLMLTNGKVICNGDGVFARFECDRGYSLYGEESSIFAEGVWSTGVPRCVKRGCKLPKNIPHVKMTQLPKYNNGVVNMECDIGFIREGPQLLYCDGVRWSDDFPSCKTYFGDQTGCDFEDKNICGWIQDNSEVLDWARNSGPTLSTGTGPLTDHTTGTAKGHYMYLENASLRHRKQLARLISIPYNSKPNLALEFYYHMFGDNIGNLSVYLMPTQMNPLQLNIQHRIFYKSEAQGPSWLRANVLLQTQEKQFQLVFEATSGGTFGDIAIDDIRIIDLEELPLNDGMEHHTVIETSPTTPKQSPTTPKQSPRSSPKKPNKANNKKSTNKNTTTKKTTSIKQITSTSKPSEIKTSNTPKLKQKPNERSTTIKPVRTTKTTTVLQKTSTSKTSEIYSSGTTGQELFSYSFESIPASTLPSNPTSTESPTITTQSTLAPETISTPTATMPLSYTSIGTTIQQTPTSSTSVKTTQPLESSPATTTQSTIQTSASSIPNITTLTSNSPQTTTRKSTPVTSASTTSTSTKLTSQSSTSTKLTSQSSTSTKLTSQSSTSTKLTSQSSTSTKLTSQSSTSTKLTSQSSTSTKLTSQSSTSTKLTSQSSTNTTLLPTFTTSYIAMRNSSSTPLLSTTYITTVNIKESSTTSYNTGKHNQKTTPMPPSQKKNLKNLDSKENSLVPIIILCAIVLGIFVPIITLIIYKRCKTRTRQITTDENAEKENNDLEDSSIDDSNEKSKTIEETTKQESNDETVQENGNDNKDENQIKEDPVPNLEDTSTTETKQVTVTTSANEEVRVQVVVQAELAVVSTENETRLESTNAVNEDMQQAKPEASETVSVTEAALSEHKADVLSSITEENVQDTEKVKDEITIQPDDENKLEILKKVN